MPQIPTFDVDRSAFVGGVHAEASPGAMSQVGQALQQAGGAVSEEGQAWEQRYAEARRQADAANITAGAMQRLGDAQFRWSKTPDNLAAQAGFDQEAQQIKQQALQGVSDPRVAAYVTQRLDEHAIALSQETRRQAFALESSARRGQLDARLSQYAQAAATASEPAVRAQLLDQADADIKGAVAAGWLHGEEGAQRQLQFRSNVQKVQALDFIKRAAESPDVTRTSPLAISDAILDPQNFPGLLPAERQALADQAIRLGRTIVAMRMADDAHNEAAADKALRRAQAANAAALIAQVTQASPADAPVDAGALARLVQTQQLSESGFSAVLAAQARRQAGRDDVATAIDLQRRAGSGEDVSHDALAAYAQGKLSHATVIELEKAIDARARGQESQVDKANFATLKTALNGYAIEQGVFAGADKQDRAELWAEAQKEWTRRVLGSRENSGQVLQDMLGRYVKHAPAPEGLPQPRLGAVNSAADLAAVWARTKAAHDAGAMSDAAFDSEAQLLLKYQQAYAADAARRAAASAAGKGGAAARPGAQAVGASVEMQP